MPPNDPVSSGGGSLLNVSNFLQTIAQNIINAVTALTKLVPTLSSGQLAADSQVQVGTVRVIGVSVVAAGSPVGGLYDATTIAGAGAGQQVYTIPTTVGFYPTQLLFTDGLVYKVGTSEKIALMYGRA